MNNYFPTKIATGAAFCNRKAELKRLKRNLELVNPVLIISPRRYGKTSLALRTLESIKWPYVHIDLYKAFSETDIERIILNGVGDLLGKIEKTPKRLIKLASDFFAGLHVNVLIEKEGLKLDFSRRKISPTESILKALQKLDNLAKKTKRKVVLFFDEFQVIGEITKNYAIEAVIREIAQKSEHIAFVFSGSNRHLIDEMFNDKKRPFFNLCDILYLERISSDDYIKYLQKASLATWQQELSLSVIEKIFEYTEFHSYYLNKLCSILWIGNRPTIKAVDEAWDTFVEESRSPIERELALLTLNQRRIMVAIATEGRVLEPFGKTFLTKVNMSTSSTSRAIKMLLEKDYLQIDKEKRYSLLDPLMKSVLE